MRHQITSHSYFRGISGGALLWASLGSGSGSQQPREEVCIGLTQNTWERFFSAITGVRICWVFLNQQFSSEYAIHTTEIGS